jgi:tRNA A37 threonylcarbamoyltransferase TsaD
MRIEEIDAIAYTRGPGMAGCLNVCANAAKGLAAGLGKPVIGVHHMVCHVPSLYLIRFLLFFPPDLTIPSISTL